jgi:hypothetical protein
VNVGNTNQPTTTLTKTASVDGSGKATIQFAGIPALTCIGNLTINGGRVGSYTAFHGAFDLAPGVENIVPISPKGSKDVIDIVANTMEEIIASPSLFAKAMPGLAGVVTGIVGEMTISSPTAYLDAVNAFAATPHVEWAKTIIDSAGDIGKQTSLGVDAKGNVHISYLDTTNKKLKYATNVSGSWVTTIIDDAGDYDTSLALDADGHVHIVYDGATGGNLRYASNASGNWIVSTIESGAYSGVVGDTSIALDSSGKAHITYFHSADLDLKYATNAAGTWVTSVVVNGGASNGTLPGYSASIGLDSNGKIHISYYDDASPDSIKYASNVAGTWDVTTLEAIGFAAGWKTSLAVDSNNRIHVSYYGWDGDVLKIASNVSGSWRTEVVDNSSGGLSEASIALDANNKVHLTYASYSGFRYATNMYGTWQISTVDESFTGRFGSIARGSGSLFVSYYDGYNLDLKLATKPVY